MTKDQEQRTAGCGPVVETARGQVERLVADLLADPGGEAAQMARSLLLGCMVKEQTQEEERAWRELQGQKEAGKVLEEHMGTLAVARLNALTRNRRLAGKLRAAGMRQDEMERYALQARKALAEEKPFDYERALNQISAVIGLRGPEKFLMPSQVKGNAELPPDG